MFFLTLSKLKCRKRCCVYLFTLCYRHEGWLLDQGGTAKNLYGPTARSLGLLEYPGNAVLVLCRVDALGRWVHMTSISCPCCFHPNLTWSSLQECRNPFPFFSEQNPCVSVYSLFPSQGFPTTLYHSFEPWLHLLARQHFRTDLRNLVNKPVISSSLTQLLDRFLVHGHIRGSCNSD